MIRTRFTVLAALAALFAVALPQAAVAQEGSPACAPTGAETVQTDAPRYPGGALVHITGGGYAPDCQVVVEVVRPDGSVVRGDASGMPGGDAVTTSADGSLASDYQLGDMSGTYTVNVIGGEGAVLASITFEDAAQVQKLTIGTGAGLEREIFATGDVVFATGRIDNSKHWKWLVKDASGAVQRDSGCSASTSSSANFGVTDSYTIQADDPVSDGSRWRYELQQFANSSCTGTPTGTDMDFMSFNVARPAAFSDAAHTTPLTSLTSGGTAYVTVAGLVASDADWDVYWINPAGTIACQNTTANDRPDASATGTFPTGGSDGHLVYRPNTTATGDVWNRESNYNAACPAVTAGAWKLRLVKNTQKTVELPAFTVAADTTPPSTSIDSGASGLTNGASPSFTFSSSESGSTFVCKLDGPGAATGTYGACTSPQAYSNLADGSYTFSVIATDAAGNADLTAATSTFTVDTTRPATSVTGPSGLTNNASPSFTLTSDEANSTFVCKLDGPGAATGTYGACTSPQAYSNLADGSYTFSVIATDAAGNADLTAATSTFTVDTTRPATSVTGPSGLTNSASPSFTLGSDEANSTFACKLDGPGAATGTYGACTSPQAYSNLADGSYTFSVIATDAAGNADLTAATSTFTVDTTRPATSVTGPSGLTNSASPSFTLGSDEANSTFACKLDGPGAATGTYGACTSPQAYSNLADGSYTFSVIATDAAGNADLTAATSTFTVDTVRPATSVTGPSGLTNSASPSFTLGSDEANSTFACKLDGPGAATGTYGACTSPQAYSNLADGSYTFSVIATDQAGNADLTAATSTFTVDTTAPGTTVTGTSGTVQTGAASFTLGSDDPNATFECKLDGPGAATGTFADCTSPQSYANLANGSYVFSARAGDAAGNTDQSPATQAFTVSVPASSSTTSGSSSDSPTVVEEPRPAPAAVTDPRPVVTELAAARKCVRQVLLDTGRAAPPRQDLTFSYNLSENANVEYTLQRRDSSLPPRRECPQQRTRRRNISEPDNYTNVGRADGEGTAGGNRTDLGSHAAKKRKRPKAVARVVRRRAGMAGVNRIKLATIAQSSELRPGLYRLSVFARDSAGNMSEEAWVKFWILP